MKIMLIDDDREFGEELAVLLQHAGYDVATFSEGRTALAALPQLKPAVIILDLKMDRLSGYQLAWHLRKSLATVTIPIIGMSGRAADADPQQLAAACGMNAFLQKPFSPTAVITMIEQLTRVLPGKTGPPDTTIPTAPRHAGAAIECREPAWRPAPALAVQV